MFEVGEKTEEYERGHALKAGLTPSKAYLIDYGACNHMVSSKESFTTMDISGGPSIHMGDDAQIPAVGIGSIKNSMESSRMYSMCPLLQQTCYLFIR